MVATHERGATLAELLISVAVVAIIAGVVLPNLSSNDSSKLAVATEETVNILRFARSEAMRTGHSILFDTETASGRLRLLRGDCGSVLTAQPVLDPLTRRDVDVDLTNHAQSAGVVSQAKFVVAGVTGSSLVFSPNGSVSQACALLPGILPPGPLPENSLVLSYAGKRVTIGIDPETGRISGH